MRLEIIYFGQVVLAFLLGAIVGLERRVDHKEAGPRTHGLVSAGAALFALISLNAFDSHLLAAGVDVSRIMSQVVTGVGFLGAGMIILRDDRIRGLTTAAGLWVCAAIGMAVAVQWYVVAIFTTIFLVIVLYFFGRLFVHKGK